MNNVERYYVNSPVAIEQEQQDKPMILSGYVTKWNTLSSDRGGYRAVFRPGAFGDVSNLDVQFFLDHNEKIKLGRTNNGSLQLSTDSVGVRFNLELPNTQQGRDVAEGVKPSPNSRRTKGDLQGMSFGYIPEKYTWRNGDKGEGPILEHSAGKLVEVSVVYDPSFPFTSVELHSMTDPSDEMLKSLQEFLDSTKEKPATPFLHKAQRIVRLLS